MLSVRNFQKIIVISLNAGTRSTGQPDNPTVRLVHMYGKYQYAIVWTPQRLYGVRKSHSPGLAQAVLTQKMGRGTRRTGTVMAGTPFPNTRRILPQ